MNIGLSYVQTGWVMFLNAGDTLRSEDSLFELLSILEGAQTAIIQLKTNIGPSKISPEKPYTRTSLFLGLNMHAHPSFLFDVNSVRHLQFDESYSSAGDFKFVLQVLSKQKIEFSDLVLVNFEGNGISSTNFRLTVRETNRARRELSPNVLVRIIVLFWNAKISIMTKLKAGRSH